MTVAKRYARAIFEVAQEKQEAAQVNKELSSFATWFASSKEVGDAFVNPNIDVEGKKAMLNSLMGTVGIASDSVKNLLHLLVERSRLGEVVELSREVDAMVQEAASTLVVQVKSAVPLSEAYLNQIKSLITETVKKQVSIVATVDPTLIGGVVTQMGDTVYDGSIATKLSELKEQLLAGASGGAVSFSGSTDLHTTA